MLSEAQSAEKRLEREARYFDNEEYDRSPIRPAVIQRYVECRNPHCTAEYPFWVLGDLTGKRVLDLGCGGGGNAILLAIKGAAHVVGIDISAKAIESATERTEKHGLSDRVQFICGPVERSLTGHAPFDIVTGFAVLHHLIPTLDDVLIQMKRLGAPGALFMFVEPVSLSRKLRKLRLALPIPLAGTPDERPLEPAELSLLQSHFADVEIRFFGGFSRIAVLLLTRARSRGQRRMGDALERLYRMTCRLDRVLFDGLGLTRLGSVAVITGRLPESRG